MKNLTSVFITSHPFKIFSILECLFRLYVAYIMISNSPVGTYIPLSSLGLDQNSYEFLMKLWQMGFLMHLTKLLELVGGIFLIFSRTSTIASLILLPLIFSISNISYGLWGGLGKQHIVMIMGCLLTLFINRNLLAQLLKKSIN